MSRWASSRGLHRLCMAAFAKIQSDRTRLRRALEEAMALQVLAVGPLFAGFALAAPFVLPTLFGSEWAPVLDVFPFIALGYLTNAVFNMHSAVLYVLRQNRNMPRSTWCTSFCLAGERCYWSLDLGWWAMEWPSCSASGATLLSTAR
ncbi:MAG: oligosaccharide flippase family protein [Chloroflexia bacterium]